MVLQWPGYPQDWIRSVEVVSSGTSIGRAKLGKIVARQFVGFIKAQSSITCTSPQWSLLHCAGIFDRLYLISLINSFNNNWQAEVFISLSWIFLYIAAHFYSLLPSLSVYLCLTSSWFTTPWTFILQDSIATTMYTLNNTTSDRKSVTWI